MHSSLSRCCLVFYFLWFKWLKCSQCSVSIQYIDFSSSLKHEFGPWWVLCDWAVVTDSRVGQSSEGSMLILKWLLKVVQGSSLQVLVSAWAGSSADPFRAYESAWIYRLNLCKEGGEFLGSCFRGSTMSLSKAFALCQVHFLCMAGLGGCFLLEIPTKSQAPQQD